MQEMQNFIKTPRGTFLLIKGKKVEDFKKRGYSMHHAHDGYTVLTDGRCAIAVSDNDYKQYFSERIYI